MIPQIFDHGLSPAELEGSGGGGGGNGNGGGVVGMREELGTSLIDKMSARHVL